MTREIGAALAEFTPSDITVRLVNGFFGVLPFVATWSPPLELAAAAASEATRIGRPELAARIQARAEQLARAEGPQAALAAFDFLDKGDKGIALFSGVRTVYKAARGQEGALEMDPQQAADAGLKALGIAWAAWNLYGGTVAERAQALAASPSGRALLAWYTAADVVLPFADNLAAGGIGAVSTAITAQAAENAARLAAVAGPDAAQATGMLAGMMASFEAGIGQAAAYAEPLAAYAQAQVPGILGTADKVTGVVATAVDALSSYRLIGAALVLEVCLARAAAEVPVEADAEAAEAARVAEAARAAEAARQQAEAEAAAARARAEAEAAEARRQASAQQRDYALDHAVAADSLKNTGIKVTRSAELDARAGAAPARAGCMGCGAGLVLVAVAAAGTVLTLWV